MIFTPHHLADDLAAVLLLGHDPASHLVEVLGAGLLKTKCTGGLKVGEDGGARVSAPAYTQRVRVIPNRKGVGNCIFFLFNDGVVFFSGAVGIVCGCVRARACVRTVAESSLICTIALRMVAQASLTSATMAGSSKMPQGT